MLVIAVGLTAWGALEKIQTFRHELPNEAGEYSYTLTWWAIHESGVGAGRVSAYPPYGVLLAVAGGLLLIAAVLAGSGLGTWTRICAALGVGLLAGAVSVRLMDALQGISQINAQEVVAGESAEFTVGLGIYLPAGAVIMGLIGVFLTHSTVRIQQTEE